MTAPDETATTANDGATDAPVGGAVAVETAAATAPEVSATGSASRAGLSATPASVGLSAVSSSAAEAAAGAMGQFSEVTKMREALLGSGMLAASETAARIAKQYEGLTAATGVHRLNAQIAAAALGPRIDQMAGLRALGADLHARFGLSTEMRGILAAAQGQSSLVEKFATIQTDAAKMSAATASISARLNAVSSIADKVAAPVRLSGAFKDVERISALATSWADAMPKPPTMKYAAIYADMLPKHHFTRASVLASALSEDLLRGGQIAKMTSMGEALRVRGLLDTSAIRGALDTLRLIEPRAGEIDRIVKGIAKQAAYAMPAPVDTSGGLTGDPVAVFGWLHAILQRVIAATGLSERDLKEDGVAVYVYVLTFSIALGLIMKTPLLETVGGWVGVAAHPVGKTSAKLARRGYRAYRAPGGDETGDHPS